jgi:hypothetical protein
MRGRYLAVSALLTILPVAPAAASDDEAPEAGTRRFSVAVAAGSHVNDGGDLLALSFGVAPSRSVTVLVNVERNHIPTRVTTYPNGYDATRGGTLTSVSGEVRQVVWHGPRIEPFWLAGGGAGRSRPNVNEFFPDRVTRIERLIYGGGGALFPLHPALAIVVDAKFVLEQKADGEMGAMFPVRAGLTFRF